MLNLIVSIRIEKIFLFLLVSFLTTNFSSAQKVKIKKILDSNLFELTDGRLIKLAGVDVPNINHKNIDLQQVGVDAYKYAKRMLLEKRFHLSYIKKVPLNTNYSLVHIIREYPLLTRDFTIEYLERGFGKLLNNIDTSCFQKYLTAENKAKKDKEGIWKFKNNYDNNTLDQTFCGAKLLTEKAADSVAIYPLSKPFVINASPTERVFLEIIAAPLVGIPSVFFGGLAGAAVGSLAGAEGWGMLGYTILGGYIGYTIGSASGVYYVAKNSNRDVTLGYTILSGFIGAVSGIVISAYADGMRNESIYSYAPLVLPGIASIIYANFIAPRKEVKKNISQTKVEHVNLINKNLTHRDLYNSTKLLDINLFKINF